MENRKETGIKVCGMRDPGNAAKVAALGPDYMGFIYYPPSPRYAGGTDVADLGLENLVKVAVFVNEKPERIAEIVNQGKFGTVQLHGHESPEDAVRLKDSGLKVIKSFGIHNYLDISKLKEYNSSCDFFLFDTRTELHGGSGVSFNWEVLRNYSLEKPFFLSGGIGLENIAGALQVANWGLPLHALDLNSRFEISPGLKDVDKLKQIFKSYFKC